MAIEEHDREDLLHEGKKMPLRAEVQLDGNSVVIGFRVDGQLSIYCGTDPVFQFNAKQQLRRVYYQGQRYAAENGVLVKLVRESKGGRIVFQRRSMSAEQHSEIQTVLLNWLDRIRQVTDSPSPNWRLSPEITVTEIEHEFIGRLRSCLSTMDRPPKVANAANASLKFRS